MCTFEERVYPCDSEPALSADSVQWLMFGCLVSIPAVDGILDTGVGMIEASAL